MRFYFGTSALLVLAGAFGVYLSASPVHVIPIRVAQNKGEAALLFVPRAYRNEVAQNRVPVVFLFPGLFTPAARLAPMARELTRAGYAACPLQPNGGELKEPRARYLAVRRYLDSLSAPVDLTRIAMFGHSWGVVTALDAARADPSVRAVVGVGLYVGGEVRTRSVNLLLGTGLFDDLNPPETLRQALRSWSAGEVAVEGIRIGQFASSTALELFISPYSTHASQIDDPFVIRRLIEWIDLTFYGKVRERGPSWYLVDVTAPLLLVTGSFMTLTGLGILLGPLASRGVTLAWGILLWILGGMTLMESAARPYLIVGLLLVLFASLVTSYCSITTGGGTSYERLLLFAKGSMVAVFSLAGALIVTQLLFSVGTLLAHPWAIPAFPGHLLVAFGLSPLNDVIATATNLLDTIPAAHIWLVTAGWIVSLLEIVRPGAVGRALRSASLHVGGGSALRRRRASPGSHAALAVQTDDRRHGASSARQAIVAALLGITATFAWWRLHEARLLGWDVLKSYLVFWGRYLLVPAGLSFVFLRVIMSRCRRRSLHPQESDSAPRP